MSKQAEAKKEAEAQITANKNASRNFSLTEHFEAGMVLQGTEVKSIRSGNVHINDAYGTVEHSEVYLHQMHIGPYTHGNRYNHEPLRKRKLLLHKQEIRKLIGAVVEKGFTLVPTRLYWVKGRVKVELALAKGKTKGDRRQDIKQRDAKREMDTATKRSRK
ncbi:MAG: SsrA-binding protein SmpB [Deltaproteobacteria bacterium]|nr:SsrA-binding protein SmpB [Deltaproteobacteria bacterium]